tara:strand:+ start:672 stop:1148 length:477 start_codon:yes stop_codon:yes gene_type:complete
MRSLTAIKLIMNIKNNIKIYIQDTIHKKNKIRLKDCYDWLSIVSNKKTELTIRIVSEKESKNLNMKYRNKNSATNVLSFLIDTKPIIGDLVLCHPIIKQEAKFQQKKIINHYAHLIIHGYLHLLGYDHENKIDEGKMERKEKKILKILGIKNPYQSFK